MLLRPHILPSSLFCLAMLVGMGCVHAEDVFDCKPKVEKVTYDLTALDRERTASRERNIPPTTMFDTLNFNLCADLKHVGGANESDYCQAGTRACLTKTNRRAGDPDRIISVIPLAQTAVLKPKVVLLTPPSQRGLNVTFHGAEYPTLGTSVAQSLNVILLCAPETAGDPVLKEYDGRQARVEWSVPQACPPPDEEHPPGDGEEQKRVGSGIGWFFLVLLLAFAAYLGLGAYYNYSNYGATGVDLIPHRDFWKEVPYMMKDVVSHLCSTVRPRQHGAKGGYIAV